MNKRLSRNQTTWKLVSGHRTAGNTPGQVNNLHAQGISFLSTAAYQTGDIVELQIFPHPPPFFRCLVVIMHHEADRLGRHRYGAQIIHFYQEGHQILRQALQQMGGRICEPRLVSHTVTPHHPLAPTLSLY